MKKVIQLLLSVVLLGFASFAMADVAPDVLVKTTADDVLQIVKNDKDIQAGDQKKIYALAEAKILPNFNFDLVCRLVLGKYWTQANKDQQDAFQREFRSLLLRTYATALSKYRNQTIQYAPLRMQPGDAKATVKTQVIQPDGPPIAINYSLQKLPEGWKVYDINIEGVSLVTNYRGQFSNEIRQSNLDGLIQKLTDKNKQAGVTS